MKRKYTIKDIAKLAGVSKGTVDRVLHKRGKVSKTALESVTKILEEIDYQPNLIARNLKNNKIFNICVLLPDPRVDPYWQPCVEGVENAKIEYAPYNIYIETFYFNPESTDSFLEANAIILEKSPDALLLVPLFFNETLDVLEKYEEATIPVATFNNQVQSTSIKSFVGQDLIQSGRVAAKLLDSTLKESYIGIIHINEVYKNAVHMQEKENGFRNYYKEYATTDYKIVTCKIKSLNFKSDLIKFLAENKGINGIFVTTSKGHQVAEVIKAINKEKISIVGYDLLGENLNYLKNGTINFLINQNQKRQAYLGTIGLIEHFVYEKDIAVQILLPIDIINSENAASYIE